MRVVAIRQAEQHAKSRLQYETGVSLVTEFHNLVSGPEPVTLEPTTTPIAIIA